MSLLKQYRIYMYLMVLLGLAPFIGINGNPQHIRVYVPFLAYNMFLIIIMPIFSRSYVNILFEIYISNQYQISIMILTQYAYYLLMFFTYIVILFSSAYCDASVHIRFLQSFEVFHESVFMLNPKKKHSSLLIIRLIFESVVYSLICSAALFHTLIQIGNVVAAIVNSYTIFVVMTFVFHVRSMARLLGTDLKTLRCKLQDQSVIIENRIEIMLLEDFLKIKQLFESVFGRMLALCAFIDTMILVILVYMFAKYYVTAEFTFIGFAVAFLAYFSPVILRNVMLSRACTEMSHEVKSKIL